LSELVRFGRVWVVCAVEQCRQIDGRARTGHPAPAGVRRVAPGLSPQQHCDGFLVATGLHESMAELGEWLSECGSLADFDLSRAQPASQQSESSIELVLFH
jgi:hypothetical protein